MSRIIFLLFNLFVIINYADRCASQSVHITLNSGQVIGEEKLVDGKQISIFLGIPYAKPPIGELRFKKPSKIDHWSHPIVATKWPNPCVQWIGLTDGYNYTFKNTNFSEDCLYLNIWSPIDAKELSNTQLKPVMFWIHGGGLMQGSSVEVYYDGDILSTKGDVIVVSINYRLNVFGFFYSGTDDATGNVGLWDQALALQWVNDNIRYFGGDPNKITIFGESAGSWSVSLHLLSPITQNLFQNAIMMSGAVISEEVFDYPSLSKSKWLYRAKQIGCNDTNNNSTEFTPKIIECLRSINAETLQTITNIRLVNDTHILNPFIVIDGVFLPNTPLNLIKTGDYYKKNVNILFGTMEDEGSFSLSSLDPVKYSRTSPQNLTHTEASAEIKSFVSHQFVKPKMNGEDIAKVYFNEISVNSTDYDLLRRTIGIAFGDYFLGCPTILFAKLLFDNDRNDSNVYEYYFSSKIGLPKLGCGEWMGACHAGDVWPVFGLPFKYNPSLQEEKEESLRVIDYFAHFAKHGYPSPQNGVEWPKYYTVNDVVIKPYFELSSHLNKSVTQFSNQLKVVECDYLFNKYILEQQQ